MIKAVISDFFNVILTSNGAFNINTELLEYYKRLKDDVDLYVFTNSSMPEEPEIKKHLDPIFTEVFLAVQLGYNKKAPESYKRLVESIGLHPEEVLFIDDSAGNVEAAQKAGLRAIQFTGNKELFSQLDELLTR